MKNAGELTQSSSFDLKRDAQKYKRRLDLLTDKVKRETSFKGNIRYKAQKEKLNLLETNSKFKSLDALPTIQLSDVEQCSSQPALNVEDCDKPEVIQSITFKTNRERFLPNIEKNKESSTRPIQKELEKQKSQRPEFVSVALKKKSATTCILGEKVAVKQMAKEKWREAKRKVLEQRTVPSMTLLDTESEMEEEPCGLTHTFASCLLLDLNTTKKERIRDGLLIELTEIHKRVLEALNSCGYEDEPPDDDIDLEAGTIQSIISKKVTAGRSKKLLRKLLMEKIRGHIEDAYEQLTLLKDLHKWIRSQQIEIGDYVIPDEAMDEIEQDIEEIHKYIMKSVAHFTISSKGLSAVGEELLTLIQRLTEPYKSMPRMPITDEATLIDEASTWARAVERSLSILRETIKWVQQAPMKGALFNGGKQYQIIMNVARRKLEENEKAVQLTKMNHQKNIELKKKYNKQNFRLSYMQSLVDTDEADKKKKVLNLKQSKAMSQKLMIRVFRLQVRADRKLGKSSEESIFRRSSMDASYPSKERVDARNRDFASEFEYLNKENNRCKNMVEKFNEKITEIQRYLARERNVVFRLKESLRKHGVEYTLPASDEELVCSNVGTSYDKRGENGVTDVKLSSADSGIAFSTSRMSTSRMSTSRMSSVSELSSTYADKRGASAAEKSISYRSEASGVAGSASDVASESVPDVASEPMLDIAFQPVSYIALEPVLEVSSESVPDVATEPVSDVASESVPDVASDPVPVGTVEVESKDGRTSRTSAEETDTVKNADKLPVKTTSDSSSDGKENERSVDDLEVTQEDIDDLKRNWEHMSEAVLHCRDNLVAMLKKEGFKKSAKQLMSKNTMTDPSSSKYEAISCVKRIQGVTLNLINAIQTMAIKDPSGPADYVFDGSQKDFEKEYKIRKCALDTAKSNYNLLNERYKMLWKAYNDQRKGMETLKKQVCFKNEVLREESEEVVKESSSVTKKDGQLPRWKVDEDGLFPKLESDEDGQLPRWKVDEDGQLPRWKVDEDGLFPKLESDENLFKTYEQKKNLLILEEAFEENKLKEDMYKVLKRLMVDPQQLTNDRLHKELCDYVSRGTCHEDEIGEGCVEKQTRVLQYLDHMQQRLRYNLTTPKQEVLKLRSHKPETHKEIWSLLNDMLVSTGIRLHMPVIRDSPIRTHVTAEFGVELPIFGELPLRSAKRNSNAVIPLRRKEKQVNLEVSGLTGFGIEEPEWYQEMHQKGSRSPTRYLPYVGVRHCCDLSKRYLSRRSIATRDDPFPISHCRSFTIVNKELRHISDFTTSNEKFK